MDLIVFNQNESQNFFEEEIFQNISILKAENDKLVFFSSPNLFHKEVQTFLLIPFLEFFIEKDKGDMKNNEQIEKDEIYDIIKNINNKLQSYYFDYDCIYSQTKDININLLRKKEYIL